MSYGDGIGCLPTTNDYQALGLRFDLIDLVDLSGLADLRGAVDFLTAEPPFLGLNAGMEMPPKRPISSCLAWLINASN